MPRNKNVTREAVEKTRVYRTQSNRLADFCYRHKIGYSDDDLYAVVMYCSSPQRAMDFDRQGSWAMMIINALPKTPGGISYIPEMPK